MHGWQANTLVHLCAASIIRAMSENEIPPAMRVDFYFLPFFSIRYAFSAFFAFFASLFASLNTILFTIKNTTIETPPLRMVVTML